MRCKRFLAPPVTAVHAPELGHGDMAFIHKNEGVIGDVFKQGRRRLPGLAAGQIA